MADQDGYLPEQDSYRTTSGVNDNSYQESSVPQSQQGCGPCPYGYYQAPNQLHQQAPQQAPQQKPYHRGMGLCVSGLVIAIVAACLCWWPFVSVFALFLGLGAFLCGAVGIAQTKRGEAGSGWGMALGALITSAVSIFISIIVIMSVAVLIGESHYGYYDRCWEPPYSHSWQFDPNSPLDELDEDGYKGILNSEPGYSESDSDDSLIGPDVNDSELFGDSNSNDSSEQSS